MGFHDRINRNDKRQLGKFADVEPDTLTLASGASGKVRAIWDNFFSLFTGEEGMEIGAEEMGAAVLTSDLAAIGTVGTEGDTLKRQSTGETFYVTRAMKSQGDITLLALSDNATT